MLPEDALEHGECPPEVRTAHLHCEDAGAHYPVADAHQDPEARNVITVWIRADAMRSSFIYYGLSCT